MSQINTLIYAMGDQADDILNSFKLSATQLKQYHTVKTKFDEHFLVRRKLFSSGQSSINAAKKKAR